MRTILVMSLISIVYCVVYQCRLTLITKAYILRRAYSKCSNESPSKSSWSRKYLFGRSCPVCRTVKVKNDARRLYVHVATTLRWYRINSSSSSDVTQRTCSQSLALSTIRLLKVSETKENSNKHDRVLQHYHHYHHIRLIACWQNAT